MKFLDKVLTVDPGLGTGYAYWSGTNSPMTGVYFVKRNKGDKDEIILQKVLLAFRQVIERFKPEKCYIEKMETWAGSPTSMMSTLRGDLFLVQTIAAGYGTICSMNNIEYHFLKAREWKGQLPDTAVDLRILRAINRKYPQHVGSAVGMGLSIVGLL